MCVCVCVCVWRYGRFGVSDESFQNRLSGGGMYVAKPTAVFWNFTKEFYFQKTSRENKYFVTNV